MSTLSRFQSPGAHPEVHLEVERGMPKGHDVVFEGEGDESPDWEAGDVVLRVRSKREEGGFRRKETSLYWRETIGVDEVRGNASPFRFHYMMYPTPF